MIEDCLGRDEPIPPPRAKDRSEVELPSGKWLQRVPRTLHRDLIRLAERERVGLNQLVTSLCQKRSARAGRKLFPDAPLPTAECCPTRRS